MPRFGPFVLATSLAACGSPADTSAPPTELVAPEPFAIAVFPDIQYLTLDDAQVLQDMVQFVAAEREARNIAFVLQEGDITHQNTPDEYAVALDAFTQLGDLPWAVCVGNHDMDSGDTTNFNEAFGPFGYAARDHFAEQRLPDRLDDHVHTFEAGGGKWLILSLSWDPQSDTLDWAGQVLDQHADHRAIVLTHAYLLPDGTRSNIGERIWTDALKDRSNVSFVLNGHYIDGETARQVSTGANGNEVHELFVNFQDRPLAGGGLMRMMTFDPAAGTVAVETINPFGHSETGDAFAFTLENVELGPLQGDRF